MTFAQIGEFDWLSGWQKGSIFVKIFKFFLSETVRRMKLKLGILAKDIALYKTYVFTFQSDKNSGYYGTYSFHRLIMGKVELRNFYCLIGDDRILFLQKCLLNTR